jgi:hypothetical protein
MSKSTTKYQDERRPFNHSTILDLSKGVNNVFANQIQIKVNIHTCGNDKIFMHAVTKTPFLLLFQYEKQSTEEDQIQCENQAH